jgi:hypothetical protein
MSDVSPASTFAIDVPATLLARARRGEAAAFEVLYRSFERPVFTLALRLTGIALIGSWLAAGAACMGIFWTLRAALPARWAFAGACAAAIHPVMLDFSHSYRGGGLAEIRSTKSREALAPPASAAVIRSV